MEQFPKKALIVNFTARFIELVLDSDQEIVFEDRLELENAVREINDEEIFAKWQEFTGAKEAESAQRIVVELLEVLVEKLKQ